MRRTTSSELLVSSVATLGDRRNMLFLDQLTAHGPQRRVSIFFIILQFLPPPAAGRLRIAAERRSTKAEVKSRDAMINFFTSR
jgi:hypothetical protein